MKTSCLRLPLSLALWLIVTGLLAAPSAEAQVLVYRLHFSSEGRSLNLSFYKGGYFVTNAPQGSGTFVFLTEDGGRRIYTVAAGSGRLFFSRDGNLMMASIGGAGGTEGAESLFLASSFNIKSGGIGGGMSIPFAQELKGYFTAFGTDLPAPTALSGMDASFAGTLAARASYDRRLTREANTQFLTVDETVRLVIREIERRGYRPESQGDEESEDTGASEITPPVVPPLL